ncbi:hypothetical protein CRV24_001261 [Beauveria bassiana]|nr:hypothetical protein CRV24_001261 [Beauveria bassiana]
MAAQPHLESSSIFFLLAAADVLVCLAAARADDPFSAPLGKALSSSTISSQRSSITSPASCTSIMAASSAGNNSRKDERKVFEVKPHIAALDVVVPHQRLQVAMLEEVVDVGVPRLAVRVGRVDANVRHGGLFQEYAATDRSA